MTLNDILRRLRYTFSWNDETVISLFTKGGLDVNRAQISNWLKKEEDPAFQIITDIQLAQFLNGWIIHERGKQEGKELVPEPRLNNNLILRKIKIALNLSAEDMLEIMLLANFRISKHELSAFFRNPTQSQYRVCKDQIFRNFLQGLQMKHRNMNTSKENS